MSPSTKDEKSNDSINVLDQITIKEGSLPILMLNSLNILGD